MPTRRVIRACLLLLAAWMAPLAAQNPTPVALPWTEDFKNSDWTANGWYDSPKIVTSTLKHLPNKVQSCQWLWNKPGDMLPTGKGGRVYIDPVEGLTFSFWICYSDNWAWTGLNYHPHMFLFLTNADDAYIGPAFTHLSIYVETVDGRLRFALQDAANIDQQRIGQDLTNVTEYRAVAGGNGSSDGYPDDYYKSNGVYNNDKIWNSDSLYISDSPGPYYKGDWHFMKVHFQLNSVVDGKGINNGVFRWWMDGRLMLDYEDVMFRTGRWPDMKINQFEMLPYIGPGAKNSQSIWVDELNIVKDEEVLPTVAPKKADFNHDGRESLRDVVSFILACRRTPQDPSLDRNGDGKVDILDAVVLLKQIYGLK